MSTTQAATKPVILIVPGAWHVPSHYTPLALHLNRLGHTVDVVELLSADPTAAAAAFHDAEVQIVREALLSHLDAGRDVVVVMHSYGGFVGTAAAAAAGGLGPRSGSGDRGAVRKLVYVAAFLGPEGWGFADLDADMFARLGRVDDEDSSRLLPPDDPQRIFYNDVPAALIPRALADLVPKPVAMTLATFTHATWKDVPTAYVVCELDAAISVAAQEWMVERARAEGCEVEVRRLRAGHSPFLSCPKETARVVGELAVG